MEREILVTNDLISNFHLKWYCERTQKKKCDYLHGWYC